MGCSVYCSTAQLLHGLFCLLFYGPAAAWAVLFTVLLHSCCLGFCVDCSYHPAVAWAFLFTSLTTQLLHGPFSLLSLPPSCCMGICCSLSFRLAAARACL